jgi:hypothetical protein
MDLAEICIRIINISAQKSFPLRISQHKNHFSICLQYRTKFVPRLLSISKLVTLRLSTYAKIGHFTLRTHENHSQFDSVHWSERGQLS